MHAASTGFPGSLSVEPPPAASFTMPKVALEPNTSTDFTWLRIGTRTTPSVGQSNTIRYSVPGFCVARPHESRVNGLAVVP